jgi:hypothetical protein
MSDQPFNRYVVPGGRHLKLLNGNVLYKMDAAERAALAEDARQVTDDDLTHLLGDDWRSQLTAAWLIGLDRRQHHRERLGELLLANRMPLAGQGFCFALARFGTPEDAELLSAYLDRYLPSQDPRFNQGWAMGALLHVDPHRAEQRLDTWRQWTGRPGAEEEHDLVRRLCELADECMR